MINILKPEMCPNCKTIEAVETHTVYDYDGGIDTVDFHCHFCGEVF